MRMTGMNTIVAIIPNVIVSVILLMAIPIDEMNIDIKVMSIKITKFISSDIVCSFFIRLFPVIRMNKSRY